MVRIIAGRWRGRRLHTVPGTLVRPTADRVKQTLFDVLRDLVPDARVLDLFAGTGNVGLEALSRGARRLVAVERAPEALAVLRRNLAHLDCASHVEVVRAEVFGYLRGAGGGGFDLVFADPPYDLGLEAKLLAACERVTSPGGILVLQHARRWMAPDRQGALRHFRSLRFGDTVLDCFVHEEASHAEPGAPDGPVSRDV
jgi:16S rRNA (guanine(966)-N(2))-methyltransferase RsmD